MHTGNQNTYQVSLLISTSGPWLKTDLFWFSSYGNITFPCTKGLGSLPVPHVASRCCLCCVKDNELATDPRLKNKRRGSVERNHRNTLAELNGDDIYPMFGRNRCMIKSNIRKEHENPQSDRGNNYFLFLWILFELIPYILLVKTRDFALEKVKFWTQ